MAGVSFLLAGQCLIIQLIAAHKAIAAITNKPQRTIDSTNNTFLGKAKEDWLNAGKHIAKLIWSEAMSESGRAVGSISTNVPQVRISPRAQLHKGAPNQSSTH